MKRTTFYLLAVFCLSFYTAAQEENVLVNKKGTRILPGKGSIAIGINADPFLNYLGNMLNGSQYNSVSIDFLDGNALYGKYFLTDNTAIRGRLRIGLTSQTLKNEVVDDLNLSATVEDKLSMLTINNVLSGGLEKRKGNTRLQGIYGGELRLALTYQSSKYTYGNSFSTSNPNPTSTTNFNSGNSYSVISRTLEEKHGADFGIGARGFAGFEYFIAPKVSVGGEFGWGLQINFAGKTETTDEAWDFITDERVTTTDKKLAGRSFIMDTDNLDGQIVLMIYF